MQLNQELNPTVADYVRRHYKDKTRYEIDSYLIQQGYDSTEIEAVWQSLLAELTQVDAPKPIAVLRTFNNFFLLTVSIATLLLSIILANLFRLYHILLVAYSHTVIPKLQILIYLLAISNLVIILFPRNRNKIRKWAVGIIFLAAVIISGADPRTDPRPFGEFRSLDSITYNCSRYYLTNIVESSADLIYRDEFELFKCDQTGLICPRIDKLGYNRDGQGFQTYIELPKEVADSDYHLYVNPKDGKIGVVSLGKYFRPFDKN